MELSSEMKKLIDQNASLDKLQEQSIKDGLIPLKVAGLQKVADGLSSIEEVYRVAPI